MSERWGRGHPMQTAPAISILPLIRKLDVINPSSSTVHQYNFSPALVRDKDSRQIIWQIQSSLFFHFKRTLKTLAFIFFLIKHTLSEMINILMVNRNYPGQNCNLLLQNSLVEETKTKCHFRDTIPIDSNSTTLSFHEAISPKINILLSIKC